MILHIAQDDKFIPFLQSIFQEGSPNNNIWRIITAKPDTPFATNSADMGIVSNSYFRSQEFNADLRRADCLIFHSFYFPNTTKLSILKRIPKYMPVIWRGWGFDYYDYLKVKGKVLILPETKLLTQKSGITETALSKWNFKVFSSIEYRLTNLLNKKFIGRVDYFSCCVPDDFESLKQILPEFRAQFLPLNYYSKEDVFLRGENLQDLSGKDVLLGNSASHTNNHIEAMRLLNNLGMQGRKVIVPLNYGDPDYRDKVIQQGKILLGDAFVPLLDYMPLQEYNRIISSCGNLVMNHIRQQAMGNISAALLRGGKVFLRQENPIYTYYSRLGAKLFILSDKMSLTEMDTPLSDVDALRNKEIMTTIWARDRAVQQAKFISVLRSA